MSKGVTEFYQFVDSQVLQLIDLKVPTFADLLERLPGVFPTDVRASLNRLSESRRLEMEIARRYDPQVRSENITTKAGKSHFRLPLPHPLDYEWRFAPEASDRILETARALAGTTSRFALLGTPSVVLRADKTESRNPLTIFDSNALMIDHLARQFPLVQSLKLDVLRDTLPPDTFYPIVVADPPWYPEYMHPFLWACAQFCSIGGHVILSIPPLGTRPRIHEERQKLIAWAQELGLRLVRLEPASLPYLTPPFERNSLRCSNIHDVPHCWRRGDLALFEHVAHVLVPRPSPPALIEIWQEEVINHVRIRLRNAKRPAFQRPLLKSIVDGDILPTVSRRDRRRQLADVWTSGNRVFRSPATSSLRMILRALHRNEPVNESVAMASKRVLRSSEIVHIEKAAQQLRRLLELECDEIASYEEQRILASR